jgi:hypothetical protein
MAIVERHVSGRNLHTAHHAGSYPGVRMVRPGPLWPVTILVVPDEQEFEAIGGEYCYGYVTPDGHIAEAFELREGDHAKIRRSDLPAWLVEWEIVRAR